jgi:hypothetical protein
LSSLPDRHRHRKPGEVEAPVAEERKVVVDPAVDSVDGERGGLEDEIEELTPEALAVDGCIEATELRTSRHLLSGLDLAHGFRGLFDPSPQGGLPCLYRRELFPICPLEPLPPAGAHLEPWRQTGADGDRTGSIGQQHRVRQRRARATGVAEGEKRLGAEGVDNDRDVGRVIREERPGNRSEPPYPGRATQAMRKSLAAHSLIIPS